ncbi:unnamed protein product [Notodromas monacha]|uniref:26S proteasome non-ATPase regulatory subunit 10 n=1 Tax=Notodromas monacha TaxID=399045 RepID=A0A7R9BGK1_9CRUS|nr:unnamed protein product [Notodromas monacha]CAG0915088.1 unnamed protein product [Notodromas monacha]
MSGTEICNMAFQGDVVGLKRKYTEDPKVLNKKDESGRKPIHWATSGGHADLVDFLIQQGSLTDEPDDIIDVLLSNGADPNLQDKKGSSALHRAAAQGHNDSLKMLVGLSKTLRVDVQDRWGNTPLHLACEEGRDAAALLLVEHGAKLRIENKDENTPLDFASPILRRRLEEYEK